jgi:hypothetical protein
MRYVGNSLMATKTLLTVVIHGEQTWIRSVLLDTEPDPNVQQDLKFYYEVLLGLGEVKIECRHQQVPATFPLTLLGASAEPPRTFPSFDKEVGFEEEQKKYLALIDRVAEMERMRAECGVAGMPVDTPRETADSFGWHPKQPPKYQAWVREILAAIHTESAAWNEDTTAIPDDHTIAWILTPIVGDVRDTKGCRILTDPDLGKYWSSRVGTELYPDIAICRRLSTVRWRVNNRRSADLARVAIEWYIEAQVLEMGNTPGVSPWIQRADEDLASVLVPFQNLGPRQTFARPDRPRMPEEEERKHPLTTILHSLEGTHVLSELTNTDVYPLKEAQWAKYLRHVFRMYGIGVDVIDAYWSGVEDVIRLWIRGGQGVDVGNKALFEKWEVVWEMIFRGRDATPNATKFQQFLDTLDAHDPITVLGMRSGQKSEIAKIWMGMFVERELVPDPKSSLNSSVLYEAIRNYVLRFLPEPFADPLLKPANIGPYLAIIGYPVKRNKQGRVVPGLRYKNPIDYMPNASQPKKDPVSILEVMQNEAKDDTFHIVTGQEVQAVCKKSEKVEKAEKQKRVDDTIHLGTL